MSNNEKDIKDLISKFNHQQSAFNSSRMSAPGNNSFLGNNPIMENKGPDLHAGIDNQGMSYQSKPLPAGGLTPARGPSPIPAGNSCPQCGMMHPPLRAGEKCPNAVVKKMTEESEDFSLDVRRYLANLQNILMSQIEQKRIKDVKKLFQNITIEITKYLEGYKE